MGHDLLLPKVCKYGVCGLLFVWMESYLQSRVCFVRVNEASSSSYKVTSEVPQGSILGSLLFLIFANDVHKAITNCQFLQYADEIKIYRKIRNLSNCQRLQTDIDAFYDCCTSNRLRLNKTKTKTMTYTRKPGSTAFLYHIKCVCTN